MMLCHHCGLEARVTDVRQVPDGQYRRHCCPNGHRFATVQMHMDRVEKVRKDIAALENARRALAELAAA